MTNEKHPAALTLQDAGLRFGGQTIFAGLTFSLTEGGITCLLGPSGVGKTSLLRLAAGLTPRGGTLTGTRQLASSIEQRTADRRAVAYMAQQDLLLPWASILDNVLIGRRLRSEDVSSADRDRARAILTDVGLGGVMDALPATLSGGMRQRAALARTLFEDCPIVLMDEPFAALDAITRRHLQADAVRRFRDRTVLLVTHDPMEALRVGHRILVLSGSPARLSPVLEPAGEPPRQDGAGDFWAHYDQLMALLGENGGAA